jgi:pimeloyl-ACP methyl ester carboxylesterase
MKRRSLLHLVAASILLVAGCAGIAPRESSYPPIVFVHGNGDSAALWMTTLWRFESNGWPRNRLFTLDTVYPLARDEDTKPQEGRTSAAEHTAQVAAEIERVRRLTGAEKVVLVGNSRGGYAIRDYIRNGAGRATVSHAILGGTPNHGVWIGYYLPGSEFNGAGPFLTALNTPQGPDGLEVTPGVAFMTIRSDNQDKFTQPDGRWIGQPKLQTNASHDGPALKGAENVVLPGADHHETSFGRDAFVHTYRFITGRMPAQMDIVSEPAIVLNGNVSGFLGTAQTNLPVRGVAVEIFEVSPQTGERLGGPAHARVTAADGMWGPFAAKTAAFYEFVIRADGYAITHIYRSPFPRSSDVVHLRPGRLTSEDRSATSVVVMIRPRGYMALGRDRMSFDGKSPPGIASGVPGSLSSTLRLNEPATRSLVVELNEDRIVVKTWPARENHLVRAEFH